MNKLNLSELDVEFIRQEPMWGSFLSALEAFYDQEVREPLRQLQDIRDITESTDVNFVWNAIRDMGINVPTDMIVDPERLYNSVYMIPLLYQVTGREAAYRAISFVLGRRCTVYDLYTEDYLEFYEEPYGPLRIDGGTWYKTTHVNLEMQKVANDDRIVLPTGTTLKDRFLTAFYSMAPINIVIDKFYFSIEVQMDAADLGIQGVVEKHKLRRIICSESYMPNDQYTMEGPDTVTVGDTAEYRILSNHVEYETGDWTSTHPGYVQINGGRAVFTGLEQDTLVTLVAVIRGVTVTKEVSVKMPLMDIRQIVIVGSDEVRANDTADYRVMAYHAAGQTELRADIRVSCPYAYMSGSTLNVGELPADSQAALHVNVTIAGVKYAAAKLVKLVYVNPNVHLIGFKISGEPRLKEESAYQFTGTAFLSDGSTYNTLAMWDASSPVVSIDSGIVNTKIVEGDTDVKISAAYTFRGKTLSDEMDVVVYPDRVQLTGIQILGPAQVEMEADVNYRCLASLSNGQAVLVTPKWYCSLFEIQEDGTFKAGITKGTVSVEIRATYEDQVVSKFVDVYRPIVALQNLIIDGQPSIREGNTASYKAFAQTSDGLIKEVTPVWTLEDESQATWATFIGGELLIDTPQADTVSLQAQFTKNGVTRTQTKTVVCMSQQNNITGMIVTGPDHVDTGDRIVLTATASYADGSLVNVDPTWEIYTDDPNADFVAADITGYGVVYGRDVDEDMQVIVRATFFQEVVEYPLTVRYVARKGPDVPIASRLIGQAVMYSTQVSSYAQEITFEAFPTKPLLVSSDWTLEGADDKAVIDENGFVQALVNEEFTFSVTATWTCGGFTVENTMNVSVIPLESDYIGIGVIGDDAIEIGVAQRYSAEVYSAETGATPGSGSIITADWAVLSDALNVQVLSDGSIRLNGAVVNQTITLAATYVVSGQSLEGTKSIRVLGSHALYAKGTANAELENLFLAGLEPVNNEFTDTFNEYGYFMVPAVWGLVKFFDENNVEGGWNGMNGSSTPYVYKRMTNGVEVPWYVYRTTNRNLGQKTYRVEYQ